MKHSKHDNRINRRRFLVGMGGICVGLPFLSKFATSQAYGQSMDVPKRLVMMAYPMGTASDFWRPDNTGSSFNLPHITAPLEKFKDKCLFLSNCDMAVTHLQRQHQWGHPAKKEAALTGTLMRQAFGTTGSNRLADVVQDRDGATEGGPANASICHAIGERIQRPEHIRKSIDLGVNGWPRREHNSRESSFFFEGPGNPITMQNNPARALVDIFGGLNLDPQAEQAMRQLRSRNKSVLDAVRGSFKDLKQGLDKADQARLQDHADLIRQIEIDTQNVTCALPDGIPNDGTVNSPWQPFSTLSMREQAAHQTKIIKYATACNLAPVNRLEIIEQQRPYFGVQSVDDAQSEWDSRKPGNGWHAMVHGDESPVNNMPTRPDKNAGGTTFAPYLLDGYRFFVQSYANLLEALSEIPEGEPGQTALDHTLVVLVSDYGDGLGHSSNKTNWLFAGNAGEAKLGFHYDAAPGINFYNDSNYHTNHVLVSMLRMFGLKNGDGSPITEFGLRGFSQGDLPHIFG